MPGFGTTRAKQKRAGSLGQSSRLYTLKTPTGLKKIPGAQGFGKYNPSFGNMLSLGHIKKTRSSKKKYNSAFSNKY